ncbi:hypothetical protein TNCT_609011 [Trichonephila clavata]|uniref:Uncharacterized protein n=1 Tax=Trichonephila clavata TaxID=2740835 RepID=A0A8X6GRM0_TRICU|nr:hypothetical protein TNCT_609011 [Trichonephila clavata]
MLARGRKFFENENLHLFESTLLHFNRVMKSDDPQGIGEALRKKSSTKWLRMNVSLKILRSIMLVTSFSMDWPDLDKMNIIQHLHYQFFTLLTSGCGVTLAL